MCKDKRNGQGLKAMEFRNALYRTQNQWFLYYNIWIKKGWKLRIIYLPGSMTSMMYHVSCYSVNFLHRKLILDL